MPRNLTVVITIVVILLLVSIISWFIFGSRTPLEIQKLANPASPTPTTPLELPEVLIYRGIVTTVDTENITIQTANETKTLFLSQLKDVHRMISGTLGTENAKSVQVSREDLTTGQEVLVSIDKTGTNVIGIIIIK